MKALFHFIFLLSFFFSRFNSCSAKTEFNQFFYVFHPNTFIPTMMKTWITHFSSEKQRQQKGKYRSGKVFAKRFFFSSSSCDVAQPHVDKVFIFICIRLFFLSLRKQKSLQHVIWNVGRDGSRIRKFLGNGERKR